MAEYLQQMKDSFMPNWCANKVTVEGTIEEIALFRASHFNTKEDFDFNTITYLPQELENTVSPDNENILYVVYGLATDKLTPLFLKKQRLDEIRENPSTIEKAPAIKQLYDKFGFVSWYQWSIANWGTKWNASDTYVEDIIALPEGNSMLTFEFSTAWTHPQPIYEKLAKLYPNLVITTQFDEESGDYHGSFRSANNEQETVIEAGYRKNGPYSEDD